MHFQYRGDPCLTIVSTRTSQSEKNVCEIHKLYSVTICTLALIKTCTTSVPIGLVKCCYISQTIESIRSRVFSRIHSQEGDSGCSLSNATSMVTVKFTEIERLIQTLHHTDTMSLPSIIMIMQHEMCFLKLNTHK